LAEAPVYFADGTATSVRSSGTGVSPVNTRTMRVPGDKHLESVLANLRLPAAQTFNGLMEFRVTSHCIFPALIFSVAASFWNARAQEFLPSPPADKTLIYILDGQNNLVALPFETGRTSLKITEKAKSSKTSYLEISGEKATMTLPSMPRIFLFTRERQGTHPPFIVWLESRRGARRATAVTQAGMSGFAIDSAEIVKPTVRVLAKSGDEVFMEIRPRNSLVPGEYAIIGDDLTRIATFRVTSESLP
jgi:hypothetical protein